MRYGAAVLADPSAGPQSYLDFIRAKAVSAPELGLPCDVADVHPLLHRHQPVLVKWLVEGGRRALFANFGLGKTFIQLEAMRLVKRQVPHAWHPDVWSDVARMRTLNGEQQAKGREMHLCPLQFDIVDRLIRGYSNPQELVYDPFGGLMTVPLRAVMLGRRGMGVELNPGYFEDGVRILRDADRERATPSLFDLIEAEERPVDASTGDDIPDEELAA
jgi:hypothetical protein